MERPGPGFSDMPPPVTAVQMGDGGDRDGDESDGSDKAGQAPSDEADSGMLASMFGSSENAGRYNNNEGGANAVQWETSIEGQQRDQERERAPGNPDFELDMGIESGGGFGADSFAASLEGRGGGERYGGAADESEEEDISSNEALVQEAPSIEGQQGDQERERSPGSPDFELDWDE